MVEWIKSKLAIKSQLDRCLSLQRVQSSNMDFLERVPELKELNAGLQEAIRGRGGLALVSGEAGIGKTTLIEMFTRRQDRAARVFWGVCDALFSPRPLGALHDMSFQIGGEVQALLDSNVPPGEIFPAVLKELAARPAVVVFEDVHWADEGTLDLLQYLSRRITQTSALVVMTYRDDGLGARHPLITLLGNLGSSPAVRRIPLSPLSEAAVRELTGKQVLDALALYQQTGGNPFYVTEVLANPESGIPPTVRDAVLARVARLFALGTRRVGRRRRDRYAGGALAAGRGDRRGGPGRRREYGSRHAARGGR